MIYRVNLERDSNNSYPGQIDIYKNKENNLEFILSNPERIIEISYFDILTVMSGIKLRNELKQFEPQIGEPVDAP